MNNTTTNFIKENKDITPRNMLQKKEDKVISRGLKLEKAIKQNQTFEELNKLQRD